MRALEAIAPANDRAHYYKAGNRGALQRQKGGGVTARRKCPNCDNEQGLYDRADIRWNVEAGEWIIGDAEGNVECTECDWQGDITETQLSGPDKLYKVTLIETVTYTVEVKAQDSEEAEERATEAWCASAQPTTDYEGFGEGTIVDAVEEVTP